MKHVYRTLALFALLAAAGCVLCASAENAEVMQAVRALAWPYYEAAIPIAQASPELGRNFTDHKTAHAEMVAEKALEAGRAIVEAVERGTLVGESTEDHVAFSGDIDPMVLEAAALFHDTGMCGNGYAMLPELDGEGNTMLDDKGQLVYARTPDDLFLMLPERDDNFGEIRVFHSLNSGINVLANRQGLRNAGFDDWEIDAMAVACVAHSKSNSGVRNLNSRADWMDCFLRLDSAVAAWADDHPDDPITFDGSYLAADDAKLSMLASMTLALRAGDVSRDSGPDAEVQTGERVHVERDTLNDRGGSIEAELEGARITVGEKHEDVENGKSRQVHAGEQNIPENHTYADENGVVTHAITVSDGCSAPRCTQQAVDDHLGEFYSARDGHFIVKIAFLSFEDDDGFFRDSWEDFRLQAAQDYVNIEIQYPWDEEVSE